MLKVVCNPFRQNIFLILTIALIAPFSIHAAEEDERIITGAGAHFAWTIFDALKPDLEQRVDRNIVLYGKNSMLGQGCNAGIKTAHKNAPGHETFGFICCPLTPEESKELIVYPLALEPIVIMVNSQNPVANLSVQQVQAIFSGEIRNWQQVGGKNQPIVVITRLHCKKRPGHWKRILPTRSDFREQRLNVSSSNEMVKRISDFTGAIGHTGTTWLREPQQAVKQLTINHFGPTAQNLQLKKYPYYRTLSAVTNKRPSPDIVKIIEEVQYGPAFRTIAKHYQLLPLNGN